MHLCRSTRALADLHMLRDSMQSLIGPAAAIGRRHNGYGCASLARLTFGACVHGSCDADHMLGQPDKAAGPRHRRRVENDQVEGCAGERVAKQKPERVAGSRPGSVLRGTPSGGSAAAAHSFFLLESSLSLSVFTSPIVLPPRLRYCLSSVRFACSRSFTVRACFCCLVSRALSSPPGPRVIHCLLAGWPAGVLVLSAARSGHNRRGSEIRSLLRSHLIIGLDPSPSSPSQPRAIPGRRQPHLPSSLVTCDWPFASRPRPAAVQTAFSSALLA